MASVELSDNKAQEWLTRSLQSGHFLSAAALSKVRLDAGRLFTFGINPGQSIAALRFEESGANSATARLALAGLLSQLATAGAQCVVIEDELTSRRDPVTTRPEIPSAYLEDRVIHWRDFTADSGAAAVSALHEFSSGYPLNAFVVRQSAKDFGLVNGADLPASVADDFVRSLIAIIVSAFDAESYVLWWRERPGAL